MIVAAAPEVYIGGAYHELLYLVQLVFSVLAFPANISRVLEERATVILFSPKKGRNAQIPLKMIYCFSGHTQAGVRKVRKTYG